MTSSRAMSDAPTVLEVVSRDHRGRDFLQGTSRGPHPAHDLPRRQVRGGGGTVMDMDMDMDGWRQVRPRGFVRVFVLRGIPCQATLTGYDEGEGSPPAWLLRYAPAWQLPPAHMPGFTGHVWLAAAATSAARAAATIHLARLGASFPS